jgi:hypothetical protein
MDNWKFTVIEKGRSTPAPPPKKDKPTSIIKDILILFIQ